MPQKPTQKTFAVRRAVGHYEIEGTVICIPAPSPGSETDFVRRMIDEHVENVVKERMLKRLFVSH
jgi:hypothetical protein